VTDHQNEVEGDSMIEEDYRPVLLDLFSCAGGAGMGYHRAGFRVIGVDNRPQPNYPFQFIQADAMELLADPDKFFEWPESIRAIHASPPCQAYTAMKVMANARQDHPDLVEPCRDLLKLSGLPWVMENVPGAPMDDVGPPDLFGGGGGITLCGSMFDLNNGEYELRRHRLFECSTPLPQPQCRHRLPVIGFYGDHARTRQRTVNGHRDRGGDITGLDRKMPFVRDLLGIDWMRWEEATQAIPPAYTEWIGRHLLAAITQETG
jgi:DNA (cytosine-5)-methyltransferase 1